MATLGELRMEKYRYRWPINIGVSLLMWAGIVCAVKANGLENAIVYGVDRTVCGLYVPQEWINEALATAAVENDWSAEQTVDTAVNKIVAAQDFIAKKKASEVAAYCQSRRAR